RARAKARIGCPEAADHHPAAAAGAVDDRQHERSAGEAGGAQPLAHRRRRPSPRRYADQTRGSQPFGVIFAANDWAAILPSPTTKVSVPTSYTLSPVSAVHTM